VGNVTQADNTSNFKNEIAINTALRRSEEQYRALFESIDEGFCIIEILWNQHQHPIDYRFLEINAAFERHTGLVQAQGKTARELLPDLETHWIEI
jgi:PAS domain-containing protein